MSLNRPPPNGGFPAGAAALEQLHAQYFDRHDRRHDAAAWTARDHAMVVTAHYLASAAGAGVLAEGGNAFDAAIAASLTLCVVESAGSGLGGMGMMLAHRAADARTFTVEGPCRAPAGASPQAIAALPSRYHGYGAVAVPGLVAVLRHAHERYATLPLARLLAPAIAYARDGYPVTALQSTLQGQYARQLRRHNGGRHFLDRGQPLRPGALLRQPQLARTLERLAHDGMADFYRGSIARDISADMAAAGGFVTSADLAAADRPREARPLSVAWHDGAALSMGPPGGGLSLLQMLAMADALGSVRVNPDTPAGAVACAAVIRRARKDRRWFRLRGGAEEAGDAAWLMGSERVGANAARLRRDLDIGGETSHLCVADADGNWVSMTQSVERSFGACVVTPGLGFIWNGYLRAFKVKNARHPHYLRAGAAARSNAAPTLLVRDGVPYATLGSTGSERMQSGIFSTILRLAQRDPFGASMAPRLHATPDGEVYVEGERFDVATLEALQTAGFALTQLDPWSFRMGGLQLLVRDGDMYTGVSEPRRDGVALGPGLFAPR